MTHQVTYNAPGEGAQLYTVDANVTVKVRGADTEAAYEIFEVDMPQGAVVPPHREPWSKAFYVLSGRMSVLAGEQTHELEPGGFVAIPAGSVNTITVQTDSVKFLAFSLGTGMGDFFAEVDRKAPRDASIEAVLPVLLEVTGRHGVAFAEQAVTS